MPRAFAAALVTCLVAAPLSAERKLVEGQIALSRFGLRYETVSAFQLREGNGYVPLRVPDGKRLTIRQVTATCNLGGSSSLAMNFWTVRSSSDGTIHHYLPMTGTNAETGMVWVSNERVQIPVRAGDAPVATFRRSLVYGYVTDGCIGSWTGYLEDAEP